MCESLVDVGATLLGNLPRVDAGHDLFPFRYSHVDILLLDGGLEHDLCADDRGPPAQLLDCDSRWGIATLFTSPFSRHAHGLRH